jgi:hypothetical protein
MDHYHHRINLTGNGHATIDWNSSMCSIHVTYIPLYLQIITPNYCASLTHPSTHLSTVTSLPMHCIYYLYIYYLYLAYYSMDHRIARLV